jgi:hypothetical protein
MAIGSLSVSVRGVLLLVILLNAGFGILLAALPAHALSAYTGIPFPQLHAHDTVVGSTASATSAMLDGASTTYSPAGPAASMAAAHLTPTATLLSVFILTLRGWWSAALITSSLVLVPIWWSADTRLISRVVAWGVLPAIFLQLIAQLYTYQTLTGTIRPAASHDLASSGLAFVSGLLCILIVLAVTALVTPVSPLQAVLEAEAEHERLDRRIASLKRSILRSFPAEAIAAAEAAAASNESAVEEPNDIDSAPATGTATVITTVRTTATVIDPGPASNGVPPPNAASIVVKRSNKPNKKSKK